MTPLTAARAALPAWLPYVSLATIPIGFAAGWAIGRVVTPLLFRRVFAAPSAHWTARAQLAWPGRVAATLLLVFAPAVVGAFLSSCTGPFSLTGPAATGFLSGAAALVGVAHGMKPVSLRLHGLPPGSPYGAGLLALLLVRAPHLVVACAFAALMPPSLTGHGARAAVVLLVGTAFVFAAAFGGGLAVGRLFGLFRPAGPRLAAAVAASVEGAGAARVAAFEMAGGSPVALAVPIRRALVVSDGALALWDDAELAAVVAHETGHLTETRGVTLQRAAGILVFSLLIAAPALAGERDLAALGILAGALVVLALVGAFSRRTALAMEKRADAHASAQTDGAVWARALEKMYEASLVPAVLAARNRTHPDLWDRMSAAGAPPAWEKPAKPASGLGLRAGVLVVLLALYLGAVLLWRPALRALSERSPVAAVALSGGQPWPLSELARTWALRGRRNDAATLYRAAFEIERRPGYLANAVFVEAAAGHCSEARALAREAAAALERFPDKADEWDRHIVSRARDVARRCEAYRTQDEGTDV